MPEPQLPENDRALVPLGHQFLAPETFTIPHVPLPVREVEGGVHADLRVHVVDGRAQLVGVTLDQSLPASEWRRIDFERLIAVGIATYAYLQLADDFENTDVLRVADDAINAARRNNRWSPIVAQRVAAWYEEGGASLVAHHMNVTRRQADRYVRRAREEGALS